MFREALRISLHLKIEQIFRVYVPVVDDMVSDSNRQVEKIKPRSLFLSRSKAAKIYLFLNTQLTQ